MMVREVMEMKTLSEEQRYSIKWGGMTRRSVESKM